MEFVRDNLRDYSGVGPDLFDPPQDEISRIRKWKLNVNT